MSVAHPCPLFEMYEKTTAECLYCDKRAYPGKYCYNCKIYMCSVCHETLNNQHRFEWRRELSLERDNLLQQRCVRRRKELNALSKVVAVSDLRCIIVSYSIHSPSITIQNVRDTIIWFTFEHKNNLSWIEIRGNNVLSRFKQIVSWACMGKFQVKDKT